MSTKMGSTKLVPLAVGAAMVAMAPQGSLGQAVLEFEEAQLYFELNDTDGDLGFHGLIDGDAWKSLTITDPSDRTQMSILVRSVLRRQGMTEVFFESDEPSFDELPPKQFLKRFLEGTYTIEGLTLGGETLLGEVEVSHVLAGPPGNVMVNNLASTVDCDAVLPIVSEPVTISWDAVTQSHPDIGTTGVPVVVQQYQVVGEIERVGETPDVLVFAVDLPAGVTSFEFPEDFTGMATDEIKFEIVTKLDNGNQTAVESCFELE